MSSRCQALAFLACLILIAAESPTSPAKKNSLPLPSDDKPLPARPFVRLGTPRLQQERGVEAIAFSPDGQTLAVHDVLWDVVTGKKTRAVRMPDEFSFPADKLTFSPDGKILAGLCQNCIRLWDTPTGKEQRVLPCTEGFVYALAFSPDGKHFATSVWSHGDNKPCPILLWETATGRVARRFAGNETPARQLTFSADGKRLTSLHFERASPGNIPQSIDPGFVAVWDIASGKQVFSWNKVRPGVLSRDGKLCTNRGEDGRIQIYDLDKRRLLRTLETRDAWHVFSPDGKVLATTDKQNITRLWDVASGRQLQRLVGRRDEERKFCRTTYYPFDFSPDGKLLATGSWDDGNHAGPVFLWDVAKGEERLPAEDHFAAVTCVAFAADGKTLASGSVDRTLHLWDAANGRHLRRFIGHKNRIEAVALSPTGRFLASSGQDKTLRLWDTRTGRELHCFDAPERGALSLSFLPDDKTLQWWGLDGDIRRYDAVSAKLIRRFRSRRGVFYSAPLGQDGLSEPSAFHKNEDTAWSKDLLLPMPRHKRESETTAARERFESLRLGRGCADGRMAATVEYIYSAGGVQSRIRVWEVVTGGLIADLGESSGSSFYPLFSLNGWGMFSVCDGWGSISEFPLQGWDLIARKPVQRFQVPPSVLSCVTMSPNGMKLAAGGGDAAVYIWDIAGLFHPPAAPPLSPADLRRHGDRLSDADAAAAYRAMYRLAQSPEQTVPFLHERLRRLAPPMRQAGRLLADLDADAFAVRERASKALERLGPSIESALRRARENPASPEVRRRIDLLLEKLTDSQREQYILTVLRGVSVLERIGTARARDALSDLTKIVPDSDVGREAETALRRLTYRPIRPQ